MNMSMTGDQRGVQVSTTPPTLTAPYGPFWVFVFGAGHMRGGGFRVQGLVLWL
jgi:hypothetical protein